MAEPGTYVIRDFRSGTGYLVPDLIGLTVDEATYEWTHRYGVRVNTLGRPHNSDYRDVASVVTWEGFSGAVTTDLLNPGGSETVVGFTTSPSAGEGDPLAASASVELSISSAGSYYLATASGDPLVTAGSDRLYVEIP